MCLRDRQGGKIVSGDRRRRLFRGKKKYILASRPQRLDLTPKENMRLTRKLGHQVSKPHLKTCLLPGTTARTAFSLVGSCSTSSIHYACNVTKPESANQRPPRQIFCNPLV